MTGNLFLKEDVSRNTHVDYTFKKACKRFYSLRILRRAGVASLSNLKVYLTIIRPILEYVVPVWQSISGTWSDKLQTIQKRALKIIFSCAETYSEALDIAGVDNLADRRTIIRKRYMSRMKITPNHPLHALLPKNPKTAILSLETNLKMFYCMKILGFVELKRQKTFLPLNIINILTIFCLSYNYFYCKYKLAYNLDNLN